MKSPAFQFYPKDFMETKVLRMSDQSIGIYIKILCRMWSDSDDQCSIDSDPAVIARVISSTPKAVRKAIVELDWKDDPVFLKEGTRYISKRLRDERNRQEGYRLKRENAGKAGAEARWQTHAIANANAMAKNGSSSSSASATAVTDKTPPPTPQRTSPPQPESPPTERATPGGGSSPSALPTPTTATAPDRPNSPPVDDGWGPPKPRTGGPAEILAREYVAIGGRTPYPEAVLEFKAALLRLQPQKIHRAIYDPQCSGRRAWQVVHYAEYERLPAERAGPVDTAAITRQVIAAMSPEERRKRGLEIIGQVGKSMAPPYGKDVTQ